MCFDTHAENWGRPDIFERNLTSTGTSTIVPFDHVPDIEQAIDTLVC